MEIKQLLDTVYKTRGTNTCEFVVLHHTASTGTSGTLRHLTQSGRASVHYLVDFNGDIYKIGQDTDIMWHAGISSWKGRKYMNNYWIGIEIMGYSGKFTDVQRASVRKLVAHLIKAHNIPTENIIRHCDVAPGRKNDVADDFWNWEYKTFEAYKKSFAKKSPNEIATAEEIRELVNEAFELPKDYKWQRFTLASMLSDCITHGDVEVYNGENPYKLTSDFEFGLMFTRAVMMNKGIPELCLSKEQVEEIVEKRFEKSP